jgi:DNA polymerase-3 subunit delta'
MDLPWLEAPLQRILALHAQSRLPHALLLKANEGWGEVELASQLALTLLDQAGPGDARSLAHPDLRWIEPEGSVIKVDDIRELATFAIGTRQSAPCKVAVVEAADLMNPNAANALLKTLEEPPADTYLLLTTCRSARLLPTIVSRCQAVAVTRDDESARSWLLKRWSADEIEEKLFECGDAPNPGKPWIGFRSGGAAARMERGPAHIQLVSALPGLAGGCRSNRSGSRRFPGVGGFRG